MPERSTSALPGKGNGAIGAARQQSILALINRGEVVSIGEFAERFGVSQETIRRDLRSLEEAGQLRRVHGGAAPMQTLDLNARRPVAERMAFDRGAKILAAKAAMALFEDDMNVFLLASSTTLLLAEELARSPKRLTITTNMIDIATTTSASGRCTVTLLGGIVNPNTHSVGGYEFLKDLDHRLFDLCIMGASAISPTHGILGQNKASSIVATILRSNSHRTAVVADNAKFRRRDAHIVLTLDDVDFVATDTSPPDDMLAAFEKAGVAVLLPEGSESRLNMDVDSGGLR